MGQTTPTRHVALGMRLSVERGAGRLRRTGVVVVKDVLQGGEGRGSVREGVIQGF